MIEFLHPNTIDKISCRLFLHLFHFYFFIIFTILPSSLSIHCLKLWVIHSSHFSSTIFYFFFCLFPQTDEYDDVIKMRVYFNWIEIKLSSCWLLWQRSKVMSTYIYQINISKMSIRIIPFGKLYGNCKNNFFFVFVHWNFSENSQNTILNEMLFFVSLTRKGRKAQICILCVGKKIYLYYSS